MNSGHASSFPWTSSLPVYRCYCCFHQWREQLLCWLCHWTGRSSVSLHVIASEVLLADLNCEIARSSSSLTRWSHTTSRHLRRTLEPSLKRFFSTGMVFLKANTASVLTRSSSQLRRLARLLAAITIQRLPLSSVLSVTPWGSLQLATPTGIELATCHLALLSIGALRRHTTLTFTYKLMPVCKAPLNPPISKCSLGSPGDFCVLTCSIASLWLTKLVILPMRYKILLIPCVTPLRERLGLSP